MLAIINAELVMHNHTIPEAVLFMEDGIIMENATLDYTITDKDVIIKDGRHLSGHESYPMVVVKGKVI